MSLPESILAGATGHVAHHNSLHERFNDPVVTGDGTVTNAKVSSTAAIAASKLAGVLRVFDVTASPYFAVGTNTGNQSAAIQAAVDDADAIDGGIVFLPPGIYRCATTITLKAHVALIGASMTASTLQFDELGAGQFAVDLGNHGVDAPQLHDLTIKRGTGFTMGTSPADMDGVAATSRTYMRRVAVRGFHAGVVITGDHLTFDTCHLKGNHYNVYFADGGSTYGNHNFVACDLSNTTFASVAVAPANIIDGTLFAGCHVGWGPYAFYKESGASTRGLLYETTLIETYFEAIGNGAILDEGSGGSGQETLYGVKFQNCYFAWDDYYAGIYKIAARDRDWAVDGRLCVGTEFNFAASPIHQAPGDGVGAYSFTSVTNSIVRQGIASAAAVPVLPTVSSACRGNLRWERPGKDWGTWYTVAATVTNKDLLEIEDLEVRPLGNQGREFGGVACVGGAVSAIIPVATGGLADVVLSSASGIAHGGQPVVPDSTTPTKVAVPGTGAGGYDDGNASFVPSKYPVIGLSRTGASASAAVSVDLGVRPERQYVRPGAVSALPTAASAYRGQLLRVEGGGGVADLLSVCRKTTADTYTWTRTGQEAQRQAACDAGLGFLCAFPPSANVVVLGSNTTLVSGRAYYTGGGLLAGDVVTGLAAHVVTGGTSITLLKVALFTKAGVQLAISASNHTNFGSAAVVATSFTAPYTVTVDGLYYASILAVFSGTGPGIARGNGSFNSLPYGANPRAFGVEDSLSDMPSPATIVAGGPPMLLWAF